MKLSKRLRSHGVYTKTNVSDCKYDICVKDGGDTYIKLRYLQFIMRIPLSFFGPRMLIVNTIIVYGAV